MDPVPDPLLLRKSGSAGIEPGTSVSEARNSDHYSTEAVTLLCIGMAIRYSDLHLKKYYGNILVRALLSFHLSTRSLEVFTCFRCNSQAHRMVPQLYEATTIS